MSTGPNLYQTADLTTSMALIWVGDLVYPQETKRLMTFVLVCQKSDRWYIYIIQVYLHGHIIRCACFRSISQHPPTFKHWTSSRLSTTWHPPTWFVIFLNARRRSGRRIWDKPIYRFRFFAALAGSLWLDDVPTGPISATDLPLEKLYTLNNVCLDCSKIGRRQGQRKIHWD